MATPPNVTPCGGIDNAGDGCTEIYPRAPPGLLCQLCQKVKAAPTAALKQTLRETMFSCVQCGICGTMIKKGGLCGTCRRKTLEESGEEDSDAAASKQRRFEKLQRSVGGTQPLHNATNRPLGMMTSLQDIETHKSASQKGKWTIMVTPRRNKTIDSSMGNATFVMAGDTPMERALTLIVEHFNLQWVRMDGNTLNLQPDDCSLRFAGNITMDASTEDMSIQGVYTMYQQRSDRHVVVNEAQAKKFKLPKGASMLMELYINESRYKNRLNALSGDTDSVPQKRKAASTSTSAVPAKRSMTGPLRSSFSGEDDDSILDKAPETSTVTFETIRCHPEGTEGRQVLVQDMDPADKSSVLDRTGKIEVKPLILSLGDRGKSKDVFKMVIDDDSQVYVAKQFFDVGRGRGNVSRKANKSYLSRDLIRIGRLQHFYTEFTTLAATKGFNDLANVKITDAFLILLETAEVSDVSESGEEEEAVVEDAYLVEPIRSSVVTKFTGTLGSSAATDQLSSTVLAFSHFVLEKTACLLAFADLQGSRHRGGTVLFDPMTHTVAGNSGLGDHGAPGIRDTIQSHECNAICNALGLVSQEVLISSLEARVTEAAAALVEHGSDEDT
ncbi:kinase-like domain-containing protein [Mycena polygramma]|nr:kinase-like domain-containing protein [Mycena polygramma]